MPYFVFIGVLSFDKALLRSLRFRVRASSFGLHVVWCRIWYQRNTYHTQNWELPWYQLCRHCYGATNDDKVGIMTTLCVECLSCVDSFPTSDHLVGHMGPNLKSCCQHRVGSRFPSSRPLPLARWCMGACAQRPLHFHPNGRLLIVQSKALFWRELLNPLGI